MYTITAAEPPASDQIWRAILAVRRLEAAAEAVSGAGALTAELSAQSRWRNDGLGPRALRDALDELNSAILRELSHVRRARAEVEQGIGA
ncbi:MAG TPA: hypothetical protein VLZ82_07565 [Microbacterium sp.]|nr:hypothetical protein [Microbacterium sp.]